MQYYLAPIFTKTGDDGNTIKGPGTGDPIVKAKIKGLQVKAWDIDNNKVLVTTSFPVPGDWEAVDEEYVETNFPGVL